ncbi:Scr1 family TA system antitoxin-like transcriptional regulator [Kutzneria sp. NPDC051319]|uniref:helix-turn-helix domain-containing protein n=1 Tax=Kutzneria sp. NPDC051319 TaxID=3155047 RepID=UPI003434538E
MSTAGIGPLVQLGHLCREARECSGPDGTLMNQTELGKRVGVNQVKISRLESGDAIGDKDLWDRIRKQLKLTDDMSRRMEELRVLGQVGVPGKIRTADMADYLKKLVKLEQSATEIQCVHELRIPGPLQSNHFCYAMLGSAGRVDVAPAALLRRQRRQLFGSEHLRGYHCVIYEEAFKVSADQLGPEAVLDQIQFFLDLLRGKATDLVLDGRTKIRLLAREGRKPYMAGDATILKFGGRQPDQLYIEHWGGGDYFQAKGKLQRATDRWETLLPYVLDLDGTIDLLRQLYEEYKA